MTVSVSASAAAVLVLLASLLASTGAVTITKGTIVGGGRIGNLLYELNDKQDVFNSARTDTLKSDDAGGPIYVCTRNNDLESIIEGCPAARREDLVFLQNGYLADYFRRKGLEDKATQALVYFAVSKKGETPIDGVTDMNPDGLTAVTGKWAEDFQARLAKGGLKCHVLDSTTFTVAMLEKHIWISAFMAVGVKHGNCTVGEVEAKHSAEVRSLVEELGRAAAQELRVTFPPGVTDRLCAYARSVGHFPTALKELEWRNGWFMDLSFKATTRALPDPCPMHSEIILSVAKGGQRNLVYKAKKAWIERKRELSETAYEARMEQREVDEYLEDERKAARAARKTDRDIPPLVRSSTILLKNKDKVQSLITAHETSMRALLDQEAEEAEARIQALNGLSFDDLPADE